MSGTVLLLDGRAISSLAVARRLDRGGVTVHVGETFGGNITAYSGATTAGHTYPSPEDDPDSFKQAIPELVRQIDADFLLPARDVTTRLVAEMSEMVPDSTGTLLDSPATIEQLQDKRACGKLATETGVPTPETYYPEEAGIDHIRETADFPVVIKPTNGSGARGIRRVDSPAELAEQYDAATQDGSDHIIQEFVDQSGGHYSIGTVFGHDGTANAVHVYEELRQYPDSGGPAIHARSIEIEPWVHEMLELLEAVDWTGPAHIDVLFDPDDGTYKLLEVNPRLWSSLALAIGSGVDIPKIIIDTANGVGSGELPEYNTEQTYRWVLPNELLWAVDGRKTPARIKQLLTTNGSSETYSILSRADPGATLGTAVQSSRFLLDGEKRKQIFNRGW